MHKQAFNLLLCCTLRLTCSHKPMHIDSFILCTAFSFWQDAVDPCCEFKCHLLSVILRLSRKKNCRAMLRLHSSDMQTYRHRKMSLQYKKGEKCKCQTVNIFVNNILMHEWDRFLFCNEFSNAVWVLDTNCYKSLYCSCPYWIHHSNSVGWKRMWNLRLMASKEVNWSQALLCLEYNQ